MTSPFHVFEKRKPRLEVLTYPHAILDSDRRVLVIRNYPRPTRSSAVQIIAEGMKCKVGWYWTGKSFQPEKPT